MERGDEAERVGEVARTDGGWGRGTRKGQFWARAGSPPWSSHQRPREFSTRNLTTQSGVKSWVAAGTGGIGSGGRTAGNTDRASR